MTTNTDLNNQVFGANSTYLWRSSEGILYPYDVPGVLSITNSTFGSDFYYYFYDWKISTADKYCGSDFVPATALIDLGTATHEVSTALNGIVVSPNPTDGSCTIAVKSSGDIDIQVYSIEGYPLPVRKNILVDQHTYSLDLTDYSPGIYLVRMIQNGKSTTQKIVRL